MADVESRLRLTVTSGGIQTAERRMRSATNTAARFREAAKRAAVAVGAIGVAGGAIFGASVLRNIASFNQELSAVGVLTGATEQQMKSLEIQARELGRTTAFSAQEAAQGMQFLAMAGFETNQVIAAIGPSLDLAAAGALELGTAADIASNILTGFNLEASELGRVADVLAQAASSANTSVEQLGQGFKFVSSVANVAGVDMEAAAAGMQVLSNAGMQAEMAGTGLRRVLIGLSDPSDELAAKMEGLTLSGDGLSAVIAKIAENGLSLEDAIAEFGQRGGPAILNLVQNFEDLERFRGENLEAAGKAAEIAAGRLNNLAGDVRLLRSAFSEFQLSIGDGATDEAARGFVQAITDQINSEDFARLADIIGAGMANAFKLATVAAETLLPLLDDLARLLEAATFGAIAFGSAFAAAAVIGGVGTAVGWVGGLTAGFLALSKSLGVATAAQVLFATASVQARKAVLGLTAVIAANPVGAIAVALSAAVTAIVLFRDEIAGALFGVKDFGAVVQATFEVLGPLIGQVFSSISMFAANVGEVITATVGLLGEATAFIGERISGLVPEGALDAIKAFGQGVIEVFIVVAKTVAELFTDALLLPLRGVSGLLDRIASIDLIPAGAREQIRQAQQEIEGFTNTIDNSIGGETIEQIGRAAQAAVGGIKQVATEVNGAIGQGVEAVAGKYEEIRQRAAEISAENQKALQAQEMAAAAAKDQANAQATAAAAAGKAAEAAERVNRRNKEILDSLTADNSDLQAIIEAAKQSERQEEITRGILDLRRQLGRELTDQERAIVEQNVGLNEQLDIIQEQRDAIQAPFENLEANLRNAILNGGRDGVNGFKDVFKSFLKDLQASFLDQLLDPFFRGIRQAADNVPVSGSLLQTATGQSGGLAGLFGGLFPGGPPGSVGTPPINPQGGGLGGLGGIFGSSSGGVLGALGQIAGPAALGFTGFGIGASLGSAVRPNANSTNQAVGGAIGGGIGFAIGGPLGAFIGSTLGGFVGSLFGKRSDKVGQLVFDPLSGAVLGTGQKDNSAESNENFRIASQISDQISAIVGEIATAAGGDIVNDINTAFRDDLINVAAGSRDGIRVGFQGAAGEIAQVQTFTNDERGAEQAVEAGVRLALSSLTGDNPLVDVARSLAEANAPLEDIANVIDTISAVTAASEPPVSQYRAALNELNDAIDSAMQATNGSIAAEMALKEAREAGIAAIRGQFEDDIARRLLEQTDPLRAAFDDIAESIGQTISDAQALGVAVGEGSDVALVVGNDLAEFFEGALSGGTSITELTARLGEFETALMDIGVSADQAAAALDRAVASQRVAFDEQIQADLANILDGPLDQLNALLSAQADRLETANALGADIVQVQRLTNLELRNFFDTLSEEALEEVSEFLGLFDSATNAVAQNLDFSRSELTSRIDQFNDFAQSFASLNTEFTERFLAASPRESLNVLQGRANELLAGVQAGNASAAQALPQVLNDLVENARTTFGNTEGFGDILAFAQETLKAAEDASLNVVSDSQRQIDKLDEQNDLLTDIKEILESQEAMVALFASASTGGVASSSELLELIQQGVGSGAANDNVSPLSIGALVAQSVAPIVEPFSTAVDTLSTQLQPLPGLQQVTIETIEQGTDEIVAAINGVSTRLDRIERIQIRQLTELENTG